MFLAVRDTVIVELEYEEKSKGIIIPDSAKQYYADFHGKVISIGPDYKFDLKIGDKLILERHEGFKIIKGTKTYMALRERWCAGKLEG